MDKAHAMEPGFIALKPYSLKELCKIYGVDRRTIKRWMKPFEQELGERLGWYYTIPQVRLIFKKLDLPEAINTN
jgi:hypothetical protein